MRAYAESAAGQAACPLLWRLRRVLRRVGKHILLIRSSRIRGNSAPFPAILQPIGIRQTRRMAGLEPANGTSPGKTAAYALEPPRAPPCGFSHTGSAALRDISYQILPPHSRKKSCGPAGWAVRFAALVPRRSPAKISVAGPAGAWYNHCITREEAAAWPTAS